MSRWSTALTRAGVSDEGMRRDYDVQRKLVRRYRREEYLAARLLLPAELRPYVLAAVAFMHETDRRIDLGDLSARHEALRSWNGEVGAVLDGAETEQGTLRALDDTVRRHPQMAGRVRDFLDGAPVEAAWRGFESEAELQTYVDCYSMPALMLTACLIGPLPGAEPYEAFERGCRRLIEAMQRTDFLADLPEDLRQGHIGIPRDELLRHGLDVEDLRERPEACLPAMERVVNAQAALAEQVFSQARGLPALVEPQYRSFLRALIAVQEVRLQAVKAAGGSVLKSGASPAASTTLKILWKEYRAFRKYQR
ncbi:squalene/phytoene synthase family protein [Streptomyces sp. Ag109_G2-15]|uniref:phytoene/squalene synthase family protein n=1 Tax=Streptomyces sp. Ag109_G2-15 TaxID=1938850 RepID=UPI000BC5E614|nr:squalene/phytoene synthase family protein [Streptomyces sp. Ag109_G2-15]SOD91562.1 phytoene synthase [Streptomyces sp. Ag109_G2-15]